MECDPSIKAIILKIDQDKHDYIVEDLDDQTIVIKESQLSRLKARLEEVSGTCDALLGLGACARFRKRRDPWGLGR